MMPKYEIGKFTAEQAAFWAEERERMAKRTGIKHSTFKGKNAASKMGAELVRTSNISLLEAARITKEQMAAPLPSVERMARLISVELKS
ncbi:hypothetical protein [Sphingomonas mucosissima]|uniref:hypothetical protein n=1 Tax=Sphingomonas mucosissima TaxID=370959 RepID=UPI000B4BB4D4|nr:hypothetical protein [Sphingomonas mucosissima]